MPSSKRPPEIQRDGLQRGGLQRGGSHRRGLIIVTTLAIAYVASHFFRASNVTIGLDLMRDLADRAGSAGRA